MKDIDPDGKRSIGVLTKPDRIARGEEREKIKLFNNEAEFHCLRGWHVLKCPDQTQLSQGMSQEEAIREEENFFERDKIGKLFADKERCATNQIRKKLSGILVEILSDALPRNKTDMMQKLEHAEQFLASQGPEVNQVTLMKTILMYLIRNPRRTEP